MGFKKTLLFFSFLLVFNIGKCQSKRAKSKADENTFSWKYEIYCENNGRQGTYFVNINSYVRKPELALIQSKKNAVHGVLFKGFGPFHGSTCTSRDPLIKDALIYDREMSFFKDFFSEKGNYSKYCSASSGIAKDVIKISRKEFVVTMAISVNSKLLREDFEKLGFIKKLTDGF